MIPHCKKLAAQGCFKGHPALQHFIRSGALQSGMVPFMGAEGAPRVGPPQWAASVAVGEAAMHDKAPRQKLTLII